MQRGMLKALRWSIRMLISRRILSSRKWVPRGVLMTRRFDHRAMLLSICLLAMLAAPASGASIYNNLTPNNQMAIATRPGSPGVFEIEAGDDFLLGSQTIINTASFVGLIVPAPGGTPSISEVVAEMY